jgi:hypothetical protein
MRLLLEQVELLRIASEVARRRGDHRRRRAPVRLTVLLAAT